MANGYRPWTTSNKKLREFGKTTAAAVIIGSVWGTMLAWILYEFTK